MPLLSVHNLSITQARPDRWLRYQAAPEKLLDQISFELEEKQCLAIVGEQHSGKMPLSLALLRLHPVSSGQIHYRGQDLLTMNRQQLRQTRQQIQAIFPDHFTGLNPQHNLAQILQEPLSVHFPQLSIAEKKHRLDYALQLVGLSDPNSESESSDPPRDLLELWPDELSADQRIRLALARALIVEPRLLICHDLTAGLDSPLQAKILNLLLDLRDTLNLSLLFVTHDLAIADHMSDRMLILHRGSIVESGQPAEIIRHPKHSYTQKLVSSTTTI
ncbi:MAG: ATP-binding cassette domain-containing protein [Verrucomicrobiales bacterium]|nr:ATP-binding cassette domain-containing protein [Verrucomicrobiales bacterium]